MPGTPYLEEPPKGLLTWPKLLQMTVPTLLAIGIASWWNGYLLHFFILITISLTLTLFLRR